MSFAAVYLALHIVFVVYVPRECTCSENALIIRADDSTVLTSDFQTDSRELHFEELTVHIHQNWEEVGVAAVVWEAVSTVYVIPKIVLRVIS